MDPTRAKYRFDLGKEVKEGVSLNLFLFVRG